MIRRSRISVRPNVKPAGRALTASQDASLDNTQPSLTPADSAPSVGSDVTAEMAKTDPPIVASEQTNEEAAQRNKHGNHLEATSQADDVACKTNESQAAKSTSMTYGPQRRKRFMALPNLAKPRASQASTRTPKTPLKSPVKPVTPIEPEASDPNTELAPQLPLDIETVRSPRAPGRLRTSGGARQPKSQTKPEASLQNIRETETQESGASEDTVVQLTSQGGESPCPLKTSQPDSVLVHEDPPDCPAPCAVEDKARQEESNSGVALNQRQPDLLREKLSKSKPSSKILRSLKTLNDPADMIRLARARKLRELLKKEMSRNKGEKKKPKMGIKERKARKDHNKMTMRELIYYLPASNPMKPLTEEEQRASEIVLPNSPKPTSSETSDGPPVQEEVAGDAGCEEEEETERVDETQPEGEEPLLVPRVKVAEDGSLIIDEESLTVQVLRAKGPNPAEDRDPIFERGSTTTYSSFRKGSYTKPWSNGETEMFYLAISMVGTDFSMIGQLFPHRARLEIKNKFKKEERNNSWRVDKAFKEKRRLDVEFFKNMMDQILNNEKIKKNNNKTLTKLQRTTQRKPRVAKSTDLDTSEDSNSDVETGEKENEDLSNDGGSDGTPKKGKGVKSLNRRIKRTNAAVDDPEENLASDSQSPDDSRLKESDASENISKSPAIKPAQLTGRQQRPIPNLGHRWGKRCPERGASAREESRKDKSPKVTSIQEREKTLSTLLHELEDLEEEPDLTTVQEQIFNKPTRSGRIPKLSQHVIQATAEEEDDEEELSDLPVSSKVRGQGLHAPSQRAKLKRGPSLKKGMQRRGKSRLVTLRAFGTEVGEEEEDGVILSQEDFSSNPEDENQAFVPMSLRQPSEVNSEVVETMEELDISVNVPDILGTSQNALCHELSCEQSVMPAGSVPCEHQLDLLVDVIEFLDPDHMEVCKEINNEAAQTLLAIGNSAQIIQAVEIACTGENEIVEQSSSLVDEEVVQHEVVVTDMVDELRANASEIMLGPFISCESETKGDLDLSTSGNSMPEPSIDDTIPIQEPIKSQISDAFHGPSQHETQNLACSTSVPPSRRGRFSKPKPNIGQDLRSRRAQQLQQVTPDHVTDSLENSSGPSSMEQNKNTTEPIQEDSGTVDHSPQDSPTVHPEVILSGTLSETREESSKVVPERVAEDDNGSVSSLKRKSDDVATEESVIKDRKELEDDLRSDPQLTNSVSVSHGISDEASKPVRRFRGPKPKPNLARTSRPTCTQTQQSTLSTTVVTKGTLPAVDFSTSTFTDTKIPEEGAVLAKASDVFQNKVQQEIDGGKAESVEEIKDVPLQVASEIESKENTVAMSEENTMRISVKHPGCVSVDTSADPTPDEPIFILSLTEIPPTLDKEAGFGTEPLTPTDTQSTNEMVKQSREVYHLLITDALVPVSEEEEKEIETKGGGDGNTTKTGELKRKTPVSRSHGIVKAESQAEHHVEVLERPVAERSDEEKEHPEKTEKLPERSWRAKLHVKPNPVSRRNARGAHAKEDTPELSIKETTSLPISPQETISVPDKTVQAPISTTSAIASDREMARGLSSSIDNPALPTLTPPESSSDVIDSPQLVNQEDTSKESAQEGSSQHIMGQVDLPGKVTVEFAEIEASGSGTDSQSVKQITPVATTEALARPGRRPKGFLSFISSKNTQGPPAAPRVAKPGPQKPRVNTACPGRKRIATSPLAAATNPGVKRPSPTPTSSIASANENSEEEPTSVTKYFFSDIFTEVDELEDKD
ncbi:transcription factor TFIIIB component B'' homolog isoform X2 [Myxocyprinus asiaticus]|uniref:transcription factor TFIIIB component B'' homolog isoform X2 n=1 Tax=Myxocyprinus asiaticus TaxID=70543 RepID=UPI00222241D5|nr:transcription factor TFIIIB component B'' homolog isoform X2 [Myxocyprinus asiaticus]